MEKSKKAFYLQVLLCLMGVCIALKNMSLVQVLFLFETDQKTVVEIINTLKQHKPQYIVQYSPKTIVFWLYVVGQYFRPTKMVDQSGLAPES